MLPLLPGCATATSAATAACSMCGYHNRLPKPDSFVLVLTCSNGKVGFVGPFRTEEIARSSRCRRPQVSDWRPRTLPRFLTSWNGLPFATHSSVPVGA